MVKRREGDAGLALIDLLFFAGAVVLILVFLVPEYQRHLLRLDAAEVRKDLKAIEQAVAEASSKLDVDAGTPLEFEEYAKYLQGRPLLEETGRNVFGDVYRTQRANEAPGIPAGTHARLEGVVDDEFWKPYRRDEARE